MGNSLPQSYYEPIILPGINEYLFRRRLPRNCGKMTIKLFNSKNIIVQTLSLEGKDDYLRIENNDFDSFIFSVDSSQESEKIRLPRLYARYNPVQIIQNPIGALKDLDKNINILLLGNDRVGKSSLVNTISALYSGTYERIAFTHKNNTITTENYKVYKINERITIFDPPGLTSLNNRYEIINAGVEGRIPKDFQMLNRETGLPITNFGNANPENRIDLVFFVTTALSDPDKQTLGGISKVIKEKEIPFYEIVTKFDEYKFKYEDNDDDRQSYLTLDMSSKSHFTHPDVLNRLTKYAFKGETMVENIFAWKNIFSQSEFESNQEIMAYYASILITMFNAIPNNN